MACGESQELQWTRREGSAVSDLHGQREVRARAQLCPEPELRTRVDPVR